jgi:sialic acid synthase SpsE
MKNKCYIIAEAGLNHNGSFQIAKKLIDIAYNAGANAVKFQKRTIDLLATKNLLEARDDRFPNFGKTYGEIRSHLEFNEQEYVELKKYSKEKKLDFIVTPFDEKALNFLYNIGIDKYKLASHSLTNIDLLKACSKFNIDIILSTGMAEVEEIDTAVELLKSNNLALLHCVSSYPTPLNECNLQMINFLKDRYKITVGYSGHELGFLPSLAAVASGAEIIERHITIDKKMEGFDHKLSLEPQELQEMVSSIRDIENCFSSEQKKVSSTEMITRNKYHVSMISKRSIKKGELLEKGMITYKNPGTGIPPKYEKKYINKKILLDIPIDTLITNEMFENE